MKRSQPDSGINQLLSAFVRSHAGLVRSGNEDACAVSAVAENPAGWTGGLPIDGGWALVADGVGGNAAGEIASALAIAILRPMMNRIRSAEDVEKAIEAADTALFLAVEQMPELRGMATTVVGAVVLGEEAIIFNVGDSRAYAFAANTLTQLTVDDVIGGNLLLQCLGGFQEPVPLSPHIVRLPVTPGTSILLCSDGLTDLLSDQEIANILNGRPDDPAASLVDAALEAGGHDNVSVVFIGPAAAKFPATCD